MKSRKLKLAVMFVLLCVSSAVANEAWASGNWHYPGHRNVQGHQHQGFHGHRNFQAHQHVQGHRHFQGGRHIGHHHSHGPILHFGFSAGPIWGPFPRYYAPVVVERVPPPVYIERQSDELSPASPAQTGYWYYCSESQGYYPYVRECPGRWQKVPPRPADQF
jgi:hypothetical protein